MAIEYPFGGNVSRRVLPLQDYAAIGDGRSVALIGRDGSIGWWCVPNLDSEPLFDSLLDEKAGGVFTLQPKGPFASKHVYRKDSNVLETTFTTETGVVRVTDSLNSSLAGRLPWCELARRIEVLSGAVTLSLSLVCGTRDQTASPWLQPNCNGTIFHVGPVLGMLRTSDNVHITEQGDRGILGEAALARGERALIAVVAGEDQPIGIPSTKDIDRRIDVSDTAWRAWAQGLHYDGPYADWVRRSALILKLLLFSPSGAIAAAATTSLPEKIGGKKNYDYRYAWVRDASYTLHAFLWLGQIPESQAAVAWLLARLGEAGAKVCFRMDGTPVPPVQEKGLPGYQKSYPVVTGNAAGTQNQHGVYGDIFEAVSLFVASGNILDQKSAVILASLADECADRWRQPDSGMWELEETRHYTMSKVSAWQALNRAVELAEKGHISASCAPRWIRERDRIATWVNENCWSESLSAYTFYPGTVRLDASLALAVRFGFPDRERLAATCEAIHKKLGQGPLLYRYTGAEKEEGAFLACSFWLAEAYATLGRRQQADALIRETLKVLPQDIGILGEQIDVKTNDFLGNMPQGLSHLALIHAVMSLDSRR
ncbi:GH15 family glucan-1,4-alpha-glucosidase [Granulicella aggregans]|uniref:GH15 family glucan-1,4-alpha-glucosidase n=1 Tax=Granulicella aggregans TaxID=474949 RepID=A0A7W7ZIT3_9BACT|nr:glycoside hydrolase family 15 protein [Granulicella aggregans]MBB5060538.1 GH15 family glucan-1,4-alpha-glucosidase [Granulicella aggregans]